MRVILLSALAALALPAFAQETETSDPVITAPQPAPAPTETEADEDGIVRLPGQGEVRARPGPRPGFGPVGVDPTSPDADIAVRVGGKRFVPGGGLLLSFDTDRDGIITLAEIDAGIAAQFASADRNADGRLTPLEQIDWSDALPTRDDSLANPARFDPNLDRQVTPEEFDTVIRQLALAYTADGSTDLRVADLRAADRPRPDRLERVQQASENRTAENGNRRANDGLR